MTNDYANNIMLKQYYVFETHWQSQIRIIIIIKTPTTQNNDFLIDLFCIDPPDK